jgi:3-hydroxy-3-methylglutaryl CoA synthase
MAGISSYGAYIPPHRLSLDALSGRAPLDGGPEKAVAWNDEDSVTMAVAAGVDCLAGFDRKLVDAVYFASTSYPFREKQGAALIARALDLGRELQATDYSNSLRAGTTALRAAADAIDAGSATCVLVIASDCRMGAPGSSLERNSGDGAAAFLVSKDSAIATMEASRAVTDEIIDVWRSEGDDFVHSWEDRFVVQEGYAPRMTEAVDGLLADGDDSVSDYDKVALYGPDHRSRAGVARTLGLAEGQLTDAFFGRLGNAGVAFAPLQLVAALENGRPGERILVANYGDGADALALKVNDGIEQLPARRAVGWHLERRQPVTSYDQYLKARDLGTSEWEAQAGPGLSATVHFRERDSNLSFCGQRCRACGAVQFPVQRVCESCFARDDFDGTRLSDRSGKLVTWTFDYFFPTPAPPTVVGIVDIGGARVHMQLVNCAPDDVRLGMPLEFEFRCMHRAGGRPNYYWKATPAAEPATSEGR